MPTTSRLIKIKASDLEPAGGAQAPDFARTLNTDQSHVCFVMPWNDAEAAERAADQLLKKAGASFDLVLAEDNLRLGPARIINGVFRHTRGNLFGYSAQDAFPGRNWLSAAISRLNLKKAGLLGFNDGKWMGELASFGIADRAWVNMIYNGESLFFPGYHHHYGDVELTLIARQQGMYAYDPHAIMLEVDYEKNAKRVNASDKILFKERKAHGFDGMVQRPELLGRFG